MVEQQARLRTHIVPDGHRGERRFGTDPGGVAGRGGIAAAEQGRHDDKVPIGIDQAAGTDHVRIGLYPAPEGGRHDNAVVALCVEPPCGRIEQLRLGQTLPALQNELAEIKSRGFEICRDGVHWRLVSHFAGSSLSHLAMKAAFNTRAGLRPSRELGQVWISTGRPAACARNQLEYFCSRESNIRTCSMGRYYFRSLFSSSFSIARGGRYHVAC